MLVSNVCRTFASGGWSLGKFRKDRRAVTAIEYALIAVIIVVAMLGGLSIIGGNLAVTFNQVSSEL
ncbi:Flp family type IVb pilin [Acidocella aromatica]|uniref:Pilus assembly protein Flp/PilA n=1 Tax=Acidocella aromatica TaxID=1303579 RepID=A0A840V9B5_9PROT|nr:Flp family type IVb pilin [Acidocella aromatica]MBB5372336.1 pilus assembly protein Flp/PilA [Acidocella aromatica]